MKQLPQLIFWKHLRRQNVFFLSGKLWFPKGQNGISMLLGFQDNAKFSDTGKSSSTGRRRSTPYRWLQSAVASFLNNFKGLGKSTLSGITLNLRVQ